MNLITTEVTIVLGRTTSRDHDRDWYLTITDRRSGLRILEATFGAKVLSDMLSSTMAGNDARAEILVDPDRLGKYAVRTHEVVDVRGVDYRNLDDWLQEAGEQRARDLAEESGLPWTFNGSQGGGGGSPTRTLTFVHYQDQAPE